jgi:hypothetical protein
MIRSLDPDVRRVMAYLGRYDELNGRPRTVQNSNTIGHSYTGIPPMGSPIVITSNYWFVADLGNDSIPVT